MNVRETSPQVRDVRKYAIAEIFVRSTLDDLGVLASSYNFSPAAQVSCY